MKVAEDFSSLQGEGKWVGTKAVFLRLTGCNLQCGMPNWSKIKDKTNQKEIEANASPASKWCCDTTAVWLKGKNYTADELYDRWKKQGWTNDIDNGAHIVLTGGEPLLQQNDDELLKFLALMKDKHKAYIEIETNGTIIDRKSTRLNSSHIPLSRMPSSA